MDTVEREDSSRGGEAQPFSWRSAWLNTLASLSLRQPHPLTPVHLLCGNRASKSKLRGSGVRCGLGYGKMGDPDRYSESPGLKQQETMVAWYKSVLVPCLPLMDSSKVKGILPSPDSHSIVFASVTSLGEAFLITQKS